MSDEDAWPLVVSWLRASPRPFEALPTTAGRGPQRREHLEISVRSPLGALVERTAGLSLDHGWLRVLGAGGGALADGVVEWHERTGALVVGHDAAGGFFVWELTPGVRYLAPDTLEVEPVSATYSEWLEFAITGDVERFYRDLRWPGWEADAAALAPDQGCSSFPPPWSEEGRDRAAASRRAVPVTELWDLWHETRRQAGGGPGS